MHIGFSIDQLGSDANPISRALDLSFEHIAHGKLAADLLRIDWPVPVGESSVARDHDHIRNPRQIGCQVASDPVGPLARLLLGRALALSGDKTKAKATYQEFLALWKEADADIPILKQARAEYARLM